MTDHELIDTALRQSLKADEFRPTDLHLDRKDGLRVEWADGHKSHFPLAYLRKRCPCASCRTDRERPKPETTSRSLTVLPSNIDRAVDFADAKMVGHYAINITWGDGHNTGIYDFRYLRLICPSAGGPST